MQTDERCCGSGTCILDAKGRCWCGQVWDGEKMCTLSAGNAMTTPAPDADEATDEGAAE